MDFGQVAEGHGEVVDELFSACQPASEPWTCVAVRVFGSWIAASRLFMQGHATRLTRSGGYWIYESAVDKAHENSALGVSPDCYRLPVFGGRRRFRANTNRYCK